MWCRGAPGPPRVLRAVTAPRALQFQLILAAYTEHAPEAAAATMRKLGEVRARGRKRDMTG